MSLGGGTLSLGGGTLSLGGGTLSLGGGTSRSSLGGWWIWTGGTIFVIGWVVVLSLEIILIKGVGLEVETY